MKPVSVSGLALYERTTGTTLRALINLIAKMVEVLEEEEEEEEEEEGK